MKKILFLLLICFSFLTITGCSDDKVELSSSAIVFTRQECPQSKLAIEFLNNLKKKEGNFTFEIKELSITENRLLIKKLLKQFNISSKQLNRPIIFTSKGVSTGWDESTPKRLKELLNLR